jgi:hypothetical protein
MLEARHKIPYNKESDVDILCKGFALCGNQVRSGWRESRLRTSARGIAAGGLSAA